MGDEQRRRPGEWVTGKAASHRRALWVVIGLLGATRVASVSLVLSPQKSFLAGLSVLLVVGALKLVGDRQLDLAIRFRKGAGQNGRSAKRSTCSPGGIRCRARHRARWGGEHRSHSQRADRRLPDRNESPCLSTRTAAKGSPAGAKLHDQLGTWVTPVICLGQRVDNPFQHDRVWIVPDVHLLEWIRGQRNVRAPLERLTRFTDTL
jgi:hypothetical protein